MNSISFKPFTMLAVFALAASACGSDKGGGTFDNLGGKSGTSKGGNSSSTGNGGSTSVGFGGGSSSSKGGTTGSGFGGGTSSTAGQASACMGVPADAAQQDSCTGIEQEAERIPIDMFIMMDRSCSMNYCLGTSGENCSVVPDCSASGGSRWDAIRAGLVDFVQKVKGQDIRAGIGFFGASGVGEDNLDCDVTQYSTPKVPIGPVAMTGDQIVQAIDDTPPAGFTPTYPALDGALQYAKSWAKKNPGRRTVVVLVTDGYPTQCAPTTISGIAELAKTGYQTAPPVRTYVVGLAAGFNLDQIAQQGGTNAAFNFDKSNVTSDNLANTLMNISDSKIACNYEIPPAPTGMVFNPDKVQVLYTPAAGVKQELPKLANISACDRNPNGGWYYDNPADPKVINVCPCSCSNLQAGTVKVSVGCDPLIGIE